MSDSTGRDKIKCSQCGKGNLFLHKNLYRLRQLGTGPARHKNDDAGQNSGNIALELRTCENCGYVMLFEHGHD